MDRTSFKTSILPPVLMLAAQVLVGGGMILSKIAMSQGAAAFPFLMYRSAIAALCVAPFGLVAEKEMIKKVNWTTAVWIFINAVTGVTLSFGLYYYGLDDTTATVASCFYNLVPMLTFTIAALVRMEQLDIHSTVGKMKIVGALISVGGTMVVTFYNGKILYRGSSIVHLSDQQGSIPQHWGRGVLLLCGSCFGFSLRYLTQVKLFAIYPSKYWATSLVCGTAAVQSLVLGLAFDGVKRAAWSLTWNLKLFIIIYSGVLPTAVLFVWTVWVTKVKGPTYPAMFISLSLIITAIAEPFTLGEQLYLGSIIGIILITGGISIFVWGKHRESTA